MNSGGRNNALTTLAGTLRKQGHDEADIYDALLVCPARDGLPESECRSIAHSAMKWPKGEPARDHSGEKHPDSLHELAARRGWKVEVLQRIGAVAKGGEVHFPMTLAGEVVGHKRRRGDCGMIQTANGPAKSVTVKGARHGLMMPEGFPVDGLVLLVEGEADLCAALSAGHDAVIATPGSTPGRHVIEGLQSLAAGRDFVLTPDPDEPGDLWRDKVGAALLRAGCKVRFIPADDGDLDKRLKRSSDPAAELQRLIDLAVEIKTPEVKASDDRHYAKARTDLGNAERFAERFRGRILFDARIGCPRVYDGRRWVPDANGEALRMAQKVARSIYREAESAKDPDEAQALARHAAATERKNSLHSMLDLAWSLEGMTARPDQWDADRYVLNCLNCVVDLRTGQLRPRKREDFLTRLAPVEYSPNARHEILDRVLRDALPDTEARAYFQRLVGCSLIGEQVEDIVAFIYGPTGTGKTSVSEPLRKHLGDYAATLEPGALMAKSFNNPGAASPELARLAGVRFVVSSELQDGAKLDAGLVKRASGGEAIIARQLYAQPFEFVPAFTLWMVSNHYPIVDASDGAIWRRLKVLPFLHSIPPEMRDPAVKKSMLAECGPALIAWAVQGAIDYLKNGLGIEPEAIRKATAEYRESQDPLADFINECCELSPDARCTNKELREAYDSWCRDNSNKYPVSSKTMASKLQARGCTPGRSREGRYWEGIGLACDTCDTCDAYTRNFSHTRGHQEKFMENPSHPSHPSQNPENLTPSTSIYTNGDDEDWSEARVY